MRHRFDGEWVFLILLALSPLAAVIAPALANEPAGHVLFMADAPVTPPEPSRGFEPGERLVRVTIGPLASLPDAVLVHSAPPSLAERLVSIRRGGSERLIPGSEGASPGRVRLESLEPGDPVTLYFAARLGSGAGGIVVLSVEWSGPGGATLQESFSLSLGEPGAGETLRAGAAEFPAHEIRETSP